MKHWLGIVALTVSLGSACQQEDGNVSGRPPAPTDSLYRLYRQLLVDSNPHAVKEAIGCADFRLIQQFGIQAGTDSSRSTEKRVYSWRERRRQSQILDGLHGHVFDVNDKACGTLTPASRK